MQKTERKKSPFSQPSKDDSLEVVDSFPETLLHFLNRDQRTPALSFRRGRHWQTLTWPQYFQRIDSFARSLDALGVSAGDRLLLALKPGLDWTTLDWACIASGVVTVPIFPASGSKDLIQILKEVQPKAVFLEHSGDLKTTLAMGSEVRPPVIVYKGHLPASGQQFSLHKTISFLAFEKIATERPLLSSKTLAERIRERHPAEEVTRVYTSGTTGEPKPVKMYSSQILSQVEESFRALQVIPTDSSLSFLPLAHILGRIEHWGHGRIGFHLHFSRGIEHLKEELLDVRPTVFMSVPRVFEKIYAQVQAHLETKLFGIPFGRWVLKQSLQSQRKNLSLSEVLGSLVAQKTYFRAVNRSFGGRLRFAVVGGAHLNPEVAQFFHACGVLLLEGYGLTETTGAISVNRPDDFEFGTVGKPIGDVELRFSDDGEILIKSSKVTGQEEWLATGDVGYLSSRRNLVIKERKKDLLKTSGGKYLSPQKVDRIAKKHSEIERVVLFGDQQKYAVALVEVVGSSTPGFDPNDPLLMDRISSAISKINSELAHFETIKRFAILPEPLTEQNGCLTSSLKVKRKAVEEKYQNLIDSLY